MKIMPLLKIMFKARKMEMRRKSKSMPVRKSLILKLSVKKIRNSNRNLLMLNLKKLGRKIESKRIQHSLRYLLLMLQMLLIR